MVSNIDNSDLSQIQYLISDMYKKIKAADTDGINGLSKKELASIDSGKNANCSAFLQILTNQFDKFDVDKNGQLSKNDLETAISKQFYQQDIDATIFNRNNSSNFRNILGSISKSFAEKILNNYNSNAITSLASSLKV